MSWQSYVDQQLVGTGNCAKAAIIGHDGNTWAISAGFKLSPQEGAALAGGFNNPQAIQGSGVMLGGTKYMTLRADNRSVYIKKGATGAACVKTNQSILIGWYDENIQPGQCSSTVERLADYLIDNGY